MLVLGSNPACYQSAECPGYPTSYFYALVFHTNKMGQPGTHLGSVQRSYVVGLLENMETRGS